MKDLNLLFPMVVLNMENLHAKRKVQTTFSSCGEMHGWYCGWLAFLLFLHPEKKKKGNQTRDQISVCKHSQIVNNFMTNQGSYSQLKMHNFSRSDYGHMVSQRLPVHITSILYQHLLFLLQAW